MEPSLVILFLSLFINVCVNAESCPIYCQCNRDKFKEHNTVFCTEGNMTSIPIQQIDKRTNIVVISAPDEKSANNLTMGPIFVYPNSYTELIDIRITYSNVPYIGENSFWGLKKLEVLDLSHNKITTISDKSFRGLYFLKYLNLGYNSIREMSSETFRNLNALEVLTLSHNVITELYPRVFRNLSNLYSLDLSGNDMKHMKVEPFKDLPNLLVFNCRSCNIIEVNAELFSVIPLLRTLDLAYNFIKKLSIDEFKSLKHLEFLNLEGNYLEEVVDDQFRYQKNLLNLNLSKNRIARIDIGALNNLSHLNALDISDNSLTNLNFKTFKYISTSLSDLSLGGNSLPLNNLEIVLHSLPVLRSIKMNNMSITELPNTIFDAHFQLDSISLNNNLLEDVPIVPLLNLGYVQLLDLSKNNISFLSNESLMALEAITKVNIDDNPWNCMLCTIDTMLEYMDTTVLNQTIRKQICKKPAAMEGKVFGHLLAESLPICDESLFENGPTYSKITTIAALIVIVPVIFAMVFSNFWKLYRKSATYYPNGP